MTRKQLNSALHVLSHKICGSREVLDNEIAKALKIRTANIQSPTTQSTIAPQKSSHASRHPYLQGGEASGNAGLKLSTLLLTDSEAMHIFVSLNKFLQKQNNFMKQITKPLGTPQVAGAITQAQRRAIIKIMQHVLKWSKDASFAYILNSFPHFRRQLTAWEIANVKMARLLTLMTKLEASKLIKRLDKMINKNSR